MASFWYTYHSHPHKEEFLCRQIEALGLDSFYPSLRVKPVNPRSHAIRPYFPGYLFVYADLDTVGFSTLQYMPYSKGLVQFGGEPAIVPESLINALRKKIEAVNNRQENTPRDSFSSGDPIFITNGILEGYEALFDESLPGNERSRILLKTLNHYAVKLEIPNSQFIKKKTYEINNTGKPG